MTPKAFSQSYKRSGFELGRGRSKRQRTLQADGGGIFACFTLDGNDVNLNRRSAFSQKRKAEVKGIRRKGACLRCRLLKRACSGEDPCKTCIAAARAAANSKALMWMECIRPSFQALNIFDNIGALPNKARIETITADLLDDDVYLDFHIPFELNVEAASSHLARWLTEEESASAFSVVGVFSCSSNTNLLQNALDPSLGRDLRLFVHLTTLLYTTEMHGGYQQYTEQEMQAVRDSVGNRLLSALDPLLRPSELEAAEDKLVKLRSLFLLLLGTIVGMRYTCYEVFEEPRLYMTESESKQDALFRLLCHYLIYIGKITTLLERRSDEKKLLQAWRNQWNKPAAFTWDSSSGLEMHYRIEPPADWIVSSSEDASLSNIDFDLSQIDDAAILTQDSDLLKCTLCGAFWAFLNDERICQNCAQTFQEEIGDSRSEFGLWCDGQLFADSTALRMPENISEVIEIEPSCSAFMPTGKTIHEPGLLHDPEDSDSVGSNYGIIQVFGIEKRGQDQESPRNCPPHDPFDARPTESNQPRYSTVPMSDDPADRLDETIATSSSSFSSDISDKSSGSLPAPTDSSDTIDFNHAFVCEPCARFPGVRHQHSYLERFLDTGTEMIFDCCRCSGSSRTAWCVGNCTGEGVIDGRNLI